jgi:hypothetical protein
MSKMFYVAAALIGLSAGAAMAAEGSPSYGDGGYWEAKNLDMLNRQTQSNAQAPGAGTSRDYTAHTSGTQAGANR